MLFWVGVVVVVVVVVIVLAWGLFADHRGRWGRASDVPEKGWDAREGSERDNNPGAGWGGA